MKEIWKTHPSGYKVSDQGNIKNLNGTSKSLMFAGEYLSFGLQKNKKRKTMYAHIMVLETFKGKQIGKQGNHKNGIKTDNRLSNLEWTTPSENSQHAHDTGLASNLGEKNPRCRLNEDKVRAIRAASHLFKRKELAEIYSVSPSTISHIINRRLWKHI